MPKPPPPPKYRIPAHVGKTDATQEYIRILKQLDGKIGPLDESLLVDYANTHAEVIELTDDVRIQGRTLTGPKGGEYINPTMNLLISRQSHLAALRRDLFFTPRSRGEKAKPQGKAQSILDKLMEDDGEE
jgi:P27 family predicted phage terminase small subunit